MSYATTVGQESYSYIQPFADRRRGALIAPCRRRWLQLAACCSPRLRPSARRAASRPHARARTAYHGPRRHGTADRETVVALWAYLKIALSSMRSATCQRRCTSNVCCPRLIQQRSNFVAQI